MSTHGGDSAASSSTDAVLAKLSAAQLPAKVRERVDQLMTDLSAAETPEALIDAMVVPCNQDDPRFALYHTLLKQHVEQGFPHALLLRWLAQNPLSEDHKEMATKTLLQDLGCGQFLNQQLCTFLLEHEEDLRHTFGQCTGHIHVPGACNAWQRTDLLQQIEARREGGSQAACVLNVSFDDVCPMSSDVRQVSQLDVSDELDIKGTIMCVLASMCLRWVFILLFKNARNPRGHLLTLFCHSTHPENIPERLLGYIKMLCPSGMLWICDNITHEAGWSVILDVLQQAEDMGLVTDVDVGFHEYQGRIRVWVKCQRSLAVLPDEDPSFVILHGVCLHSCVVALTICLLPRRRSSRGAAP